MSSILKVNTIQDQDGNNIINESSNTITIGASGDTVTIPSGATLSNSGTTTITGNLDVDGGTIKLDGNYPTGTGNVALGDGALDDGSLSGGCNTAIGSCSMTANTSGNRNTAVGRTSLNANTTGSYPRFPALCSVRTLPTGRRRRTRSCSRSCPG